MWKVIILLVLVVFLVFWLLREGSVLYSPAANITRNVATELVRPYKPVSPSLAQIFGDNHDWTATLSAKRIRTVVTAGDVSLARTVNARVLQAGDVNWPFLKVAALLRGADVTFVNLESPLITSCPLTNEGMRLCGNSKSVNGLKAAGVDVVSLANNHATDYGTKGVGETVDSLRAVGIDMVGLAKNNLVVKDVKGVKFAFLGFDDVTGGNRVVAQADEEKMQLAIKGAKEQADVVVIMFHFGSEYRVGPSERQRTLGRLAIDSGADVVVGNHSHWIGSLEKYRGKLILYSCGNFVFDQEWSLKTREGLLVTYVFYDKELIDVQLRPILISNYGQPDLLSVSDSQKILDEMRKTSMSD